MLYLIESINISYWFSSYKWAILSVSFLLFIFYLNKLHSKNLKIVAAESNEALPIEPKSIGEALLLHQQKTMMQINSKNRDLNLKNNEKVRKFRFSTQELNKIEQVPNKQENLPGEDKKICVNFKLLEKFDIILPKIKGTYDDFLEAIEKFCGIFTDSTENLEQMQSLLHQKKYREIVEILDTHIEQHDQAFLLKKSKFYRWLQYGGLLEISDEHGASFVIDHHNLLLCDEIYLLIQELLVKYYNESNNSSLENIESLIDYVALEDLEKMNYEKTYSQMGDDVSDLLVEDFFHTLNAKKRDYTIKYRSLRLIFGNDNQDVYRIGELIWTAIQDIRKVHQTIKEKIALSTAEIQHLILSKETASDKILDPKPTKYTKAEINEEQKLRAFIIKINEFLNWYPQDETLLSENDRDILNYFDRLLYSRKSRFSIIRDSQKKEVGKIFAEKINIVSSQLEYTDRIMEKITIDKIIGMEIKIAVPRQCEDYFPVKGIVYNIFQEETEIGNITKLEVTEKNSLRSTVTFTGNNIDFVDCTGIALS